ncbi:MAG: hypothetical protein HKN82_11015, partial [Akkermansiaceae bacterium]|nr:hypothetical protein [Akkermansiaceae bacterium]
MPLAEPWHLKARAHECATTGRPFAEDEPFYTALFPDPESSGYLRQDFSEDAWNNRADDAPRPFSFWRSIYKPPPHEEKPEEVVKDDPESLLRRMVEEDEAHTENVRYILAVMLERKKILLETDAQQTPSGLLRIYEHRHTGEVFIVKDPQVPLAEVQPLQDEVQAMLEPKPDTPDTPDTSD